MKRCPGCRRNYYDDSLLYCLDDGTALLEGPASADGAPTAIYGLGGLTPFDAMTEAMAGAAVAMAPPTASIAVLPFAHMSSDPDSEYFCDGLAEELINSLARVDDLKVVARTSAFSFKNQNIPISEIGSKLNVQHIVEGSVRKFGERMRITVQLIKASDGYHLWSGKYDTEMRDLFDVQDEITLSVVSALKSKLLGQPQNQDAAQMASLIADLKHHAHDVLAYQLYLRGRYFLNKFTPDDFYRAIDCLNQALGIDENFAAAYAGLAETHVMLTEFGPVPSLEGLPRAKEAALKAIALDDSLSEAHVSLALVLQEFDYDFARAEEEYKLALDLNPNNAIAHEYYGSLLAQLGRHEEAEVQCLKAIELDPLSAISGWVYPFALYLARQYDEALAESNRVRELDPNFSATYLILSVLYQLRSEYADSVDAYLRFLELCDVSEIAAEGRRAFEAEGWDGFLSRMTADDIRTQLSAYMAAANYAALGDNEAALSSLEESFTRREGFIVMLKQDPRFDDLRGNARFQSLLNKIGFPD